MATKKKLQTRSRSLIIRSVDLPAEKRALIQVATPAEFIRERPGKGGKTFRYIEGGYVIARLNQIFSPIGWDFDVVNQQIEPNEVIVRGRLTIKDFKTGFSIGKTRTGTKERIAGISLGDTIKAAETDALKKCASHLGIGLDVYWQQLDEDKLTKAGSRTPKAPEVPVRATQAKQTKAQSEEAIKIALEKIKAETDPTILTQYRVRIMAFSGYSDAQKLTLIKAIASQMKKNVKRDSEQEHLL